MKSATTAMPTPEVKIDPKTLPLLNKVLACVQQREEQVKKILKTPHTPKDEDDHEEPLEPIWSWVQEHNLFLPLTNFTEPELLDMVRASQEWAQRFRSRGPRPKIGVADGWLLTLILFKSARDYQDIASQYRLSESTLHETINRMRPIIFHTLEQRWWTIRKRPQPLENTSYAHIGLICDSTSVQVFRPRGTFAEAKRYFDGKNWIYALKKECAVMASPPHYCLFSPPYKMGSTHDYNILKETCPTYTPYLLKTTEENHALKQDKKDRRWAMLCDSGYIGDADDTPGLRRIALTKPSRRKTHEQRVEGTELARLRVPVEQYFGRLTKLWGILSSTYKYDQDHFDIDFNICALLTNEHIKVNQLEEIDREFYLALLEHRKLATEQKQKRECESHQKCYERKKSRLESIL